MQRTFALVAALSIVATGAQAQRAWQTEVGVQGGYTRVVAAGLGADPTDLIGLPGFNLGPLIPSSPGVYAIIPWKDKIAVDLDFGVSQLNTGGTSLTLFQLDARGDYAVTKKVYAGAGGGIGYVETGGTSETQLGLQAAVGYRLGLSNSLKGNVEFRATFWGNTQNVGAIDTYALLFRVGAAPHRSAAPARRASASNARTGAWTPLLGVSAGYASIHAVGGGDVSAIAFPGYGAGLGNIVGTEITLPPTLFAILPIGKKIAIEPGVDLHRTQESGTTSFLGNLSGRLNYAVHGGWYGAAGVNLNYAKQSGASAATRTGANVAWGYRFPFWGTLGGRVELNYTMYKPNTDLATPATNIVGLMFGTTMSLK